MRALTRHKNNSIILKNMPEPEIKNPDEVKIRIVYGTLCRDEMHSDEFNLFFHNEILGHEASGIIMDAGEEAIKHGHHPGQRVALIPITSCGHCKYCQAQLPQYCLEVNMTLGYFSDFVVQKYTQVLPIQDHISFRQAALIEPVGDVLEALSKVDLDFSSEVLIIGSGFIGLVFLYLLRMRGIKKIIVIEPIEARRKLAKDFQADQAFDSNMPNLQLELLKLTQFNGFNCIIDTSARLDIFDFASPCLARGGTLLMAAYNNVQSKLMLPVLDMYVNNTKIIWSCLCGKNNMEVAAYLIPKLHLDSLITAEYSLNQGVEAYYKYLKSDEIKIGLIFDQI